MTVLRSDSVVVAVSVVVVVVVEVLVVVWVVVSMVVSVTVPSAPVSVFVSVVVTGAETTGSSSTGPFVPVETVWSFSSFLSVVVMVVVPVFSSYDCCSAN